MPDATLYLFDGYNLMHAGDFSDRSELVNRLASFVAERGARGILVFDGVGDDADIGPLAVRFAPDADSLLERLAAENRRLERVLVVSSDATLLRTAGSEVASTRAARFLRELDSSTGTPAASGGLAGKLEPEMRERLERLRRGDDPL